MTAQKAKPAYIVAAYVVDSELESTLNGHFRQGYDVLRMFRNEPNSAKVETTTVVFMDAGLINVDK